MKEQYHSRSRFGSIGRMLFASQLISFCRKFVLCVLSVGPIPNHIAFIMDGNRRYAKKKNMDEGSGHRVGYSAPMSKLRYLYDLGVKYVTVYALSIDNFNRNPDEVQRLMDLMLEKIEGLLKEDSIVNEYSIRVYFIGNLNLLNEPVRVAAENVMRATAHNTERVLLICVAYASSSEIVHAVQESCADKRKEIEPFNSATTRNGVIKEFRGDVHNVHEANEFVAMKSSPASNTDVKNGMVEQSGEGSWKGETANGANAIEAGEKMPEKPSLIKVVDIEKHLYMSVAPDPDLLIRTSGKTRLSNFLLWQTSNCLLYSPKALWPEISEWNVLWGIITYQRSHAYLEKKKKQP